MPSAALFIKYAGLLDTMPNTSGQCSIVVCVTSCSPPILTTVPGSYASSLVYNSARSAYSAVVAVPCIFKPDAIVKPSSILFPGKCPRNGAADASLVLKSNDSLANATIGLLVPAAPPVYWPVASTT